MCDQWSDITLWWNILTPLEARGCDEGGSKAARQQYQRECKKGSDDWFLSQQWQATARLHYTSKTSEVGGISSFSAQGRRVSDHSFRRRWLGMKSLIEKHFWAIVSFSSSFLSKHLLWCCKLLWSKDFLHKISRKPDARWNIKYLSTHIQHTARILVLTRILNEGKFANYIRIQ